MKKELKKNETIKNLQNRYYFFSKMGKNIGVDILSGSVIEVDDDFYNAVNFKKEISNNMLDEAMELIEETDKTCEFKEYAQKLSNRVIYPKSMCLNVSHICNMKCSYCFAFDVLCDTSENIMTTDTALKSIDYLFESPYPSVEIDFFGGEPLLNWDTVKNAVIYAKEKAKQTKKKLKLALTTNGILLDKEKAGFLNEHDINITFSLDGNREVNDLLRKRADGSGTFDTVSENFIRTAGSRDNKNYYLRGTYTKKTLEIFKSFKFLHSLGFNSLSLEAVVTGNKDLKISMKDISFIEEEYDKLARYYFEKKKNGENIEFYHFNLNIYDQPCINKRLSGCQAGAEYLAISPIGEIYPCHQFIGNEKLRLGTLDRGIDNIKVQDGFKKANIFNQKKCLNCWAKYFCSGGCFYANYESNSDILEPDEINCKIMKIRLKYAIILDLKLKE